ncbi:LOW QUALITY PROTEIN: hypothetical protein RJ641_029072 [Dillenia turbinata]|uniref:Importin-7/11-like TPR repeats domain-containing protein n=1 Tax=Dillenia turbinata TaxID=194707 RepID=A0AAN8ZIU8_9MAGN
MGRFKEIPDWCLLALIWQVLEKVSLVALTDLRSHSDGEVLSRSPRCFAGRDLASVAANIIESYVILGGNAFPSACASMLAKILDLIVGNVNNRGLRSTLLVFDILIQVLEKLNQILGGDNIYSTGFHHEGTIPTEELRKRQVILHVVVGVLASLFPNERIILPCNTLRRRKLPLDVCQNPEQFQHEQGMIKWTHELRLCTEALYIVLFETHSQVAIVLSVFNHFTEGRCLYFIVTSVVIAATRACGGIHSPGGYEWMPSFCNRNCSRHAISRMLLMELLHMFYGALSHELTNDHPNMRIIHRKVAQLLGQWVSEIEDDTKRAVYYALIRLLQDKDLAVRPVARWFFILKMQTFQSKILPIFFQSVGISKPNGSNISVGRIATTTDPALRCCNPLIWEESSGESLLQIQISNALRIFVAVSGQKSPICHNMRWPTLQRGIDIKSPDELNLLEDGMLVSNNHIAVMGSYINACSINGPQLLECFPCLLEILERSFDHLQVTVNNIESYVILGGNAFLSALASTPAKILDLIVRNVNDGGFLSTLLDIVFPPGGAAIGQQCSSGAKLFAVYLLASLYRKAATIGCFSWIWQKLIVMCLSGGDDYVPSKTAVKVSIAAILAWILIMNTSYLAQLASEPSLFVTSPECGISNRRECSSVFGWHMVGEGRPLVDHVTSIQRKTIGLVALSIILTLRVPQVLEKLDRILSVCTSVLMGGNDEFSEEESRSHQSDVIGGLSKRESYNSVIGRMPPGAFAQLKQTPNDSVNSVEEVGILVLNSRTECPRLLGPVVASILQEAVNGFPAAVTEISPGMLLMELQHMYLRIQF